jgi:NAD(P)-dependent dehydrogenase (short-subunit alcohol dehydrogenase family)
MRLKDKIAIVAGGALGIGEGIVRCLAQEGADIAVIDIDGDAASHTAEEVKAIGRRALPLTADLTEENQVNGAVKDTVDFFGRIDILVNNVGGVSIETSQMLEKYKVSQQNAAVSPVFLRFSPDVWDRYYQLNLKSHVLLSNAVTPYFIRQKSGKIVNISSVSGRFGDHGHMPYAAMKAGDISLTWSLAQALAPYNINVNCVCPGFVYTPLWERGADNNLKEMRDTVRKIRERGESLPRPLARFTDVDLENMTPRDYWLKFTVRPSNPMRKEQTAEDIGRAVVFFVSDDAQNITGQVLHVDGGQIMR